MYLVGNSFHVSFKWVVIISTKQEAAHTQSAKVSTCNTLWGLVTNNREGEGGGATNGRRGGVSEILPLQKKGGAGFFFSCAEWGGGGTNSFEVVLTWELEILAIVIGGGAQKVSTL